MASGIERGSFRWWLKIEEENVRGADETEPRKFTFEMLCDEILKVKMAFDRNYQSSADQVQYARDAEEVVVKLSIKRFMHNEDYKKQGGKITMGLLNEISKTIFRTFTSDIAEKLPEQAKQTLLAGVKQIGNERSNNRNGEDVLGGEGNQTEMPKPRILCEDLVYVVPAMKLPRFIPKDISGFQIIKFENVLEKFDFSNVTRVVIFAETKSSCSYYEELFHFLVNLPERINVDVIPMPLESSPVDLHRIEEFYKTLKHSRDLVEVIHPTAIHPLSQVQICLYHLHAGIMDLEEAWVAYFKALGDILRESNREAGFNWGREGLH